MKRMLQLNLIAVLLMTCVAVLATAAPLAALETEASPPDQSTVYDEMPPPERRDSNQPNHYGNSPWAPPDKDDSNFPQDEGLYLDRYLFRSDVPNGRLTFDIEIDRYYTPLITPASLDPNGFLRPNVLLDLIERNLLPEMATLTLAVYDVDHDASPCPEVDHVYINDNQIQDPSGSGPFKLTSGNNRWDVLRVPFPIGFLKFPVEQGTNGQGPTPTVNQIAVEIDVQCGTSWAVEVDWGSIEIPSPIRPIVFAHGWTGNQDTFDTFQGWLGEDGIPVQDVQTDLWRGIYPIATTSPLLASAISSTAQEFGVDKVNVFAHSKGGLVSRHALRTDNVANKVDRLITFGSPHHGTNWASVWAQVSCRVQFSGEDERRCFTAADELSEGSIRDAFNYSGCTRGPWPWSNWTGCRPEYVRQPSVTYRSLVGGPADVGAKTATYPWLADDVPFPNHGNVDAQFLWDHNNIKQKAGPYRCAISYIDSSIYSSLWCLSPVREPDELANDESPVWPGNEFQSVMEEQDSLAAGMSQTISALVDGGTYALFNVLSDVPLTFTLIDPNGRVIDPTAAAGDPAIAYFAQLDPESGLFWWYQYVVSNPMAGEWQNVIDAADPVMYSAFTMVDSAVQLHYKTDRYTYAPGEVVTVEAALASANVPILGAQMSGAVQNSDGSQLSLPLYDDGTHGDVTPGDGVYTGQFTAAGATGHASIELSGTEGLVSRTVTTSVAVAAQTAEFQAVTAETPVDTNANGLYDMLNLSAQLNVITSGHFEISAMLVDSNDERIASGFFSTRLSGLDPLAAGLQTIILSFDGNTIRQHGVDGPYQLTNLIIRDVSDGSFEVDTAVNVYTTAAYQANQFEAPLISLAGGSEEVIDTNANGLYDQLRILVNVNVVRTGTYNWSGRLVDQRGAEISWTQGVGTLNNQTPMAFTFAGQLIGAHGQDGPYVLRDVSIYQTSGGNATALFEEAYVTEPYSYMDFEGGIPANVASIVITKTVGLVDGVCAAESEINVATGATVYYCYTVTNTGDVTLDLHDLEDDVLGNLFTGLPYALAPDSSVSTVNAGLSFPYVANTSTTNVATWTTYNATGLSATAVATATVNVASIYLVKTVGTTPGVCATTDEITVPAGTRVFYCYTVVNTGDVTLNQHDLVDDQLGPIFMAYPYALTPGSSVNTVAAGLSLSAIINSTTTNVAAWMAYNDGGPVVTATDTATVIVAPPTAVTLADLSAAQAPPPVSGLPLAALPAVGSLALGAAYALRRRQ